MKARTHGQCPDCWHFGSSCQCHAIDQPSRLERLEEEQLALKASLGTNKFSDAVIALRLNAIAVAIRNEQVTA